MAYLFSPGQEPKNTLFLKFKDVDNFCSPDNIRNFIKRIKIVNPELSVAEFGKLWTAQAQTIFNLSESEAKQILGSITTEEYKDLVNQYTPYDLDVEVVIKLISKPTKDTMNLFVKIVGCDNPKLLSYINTCIVALFNFEDESKNNNVEENDEKSGRK